MVSEAQISGLLNFLHFHIYVVCIILGDFYNMVRNSPMQVWQTAGTGSIKTKRVHRARLHYVAGHHSTSQENKVGPLCCKVDARWPQTLANILKCPYFPVKCGCD